MQFQNLQIDLNVKVDIYTYTDKMLPRLIYGSKWENCDVPVRELVNDEIYWHEFLSDDDSVTQPLIQPPVAVLLFEYYYDRDKLKEIYMKQNPEAKKYNCRDY